MSFENARQNLEKFIQELHLEGLEFDENHSCVFVVDHEFSLYVTYEPNFDRLVLTSTLLEGLPHNDRDKLKLYEYLLEASALGRQFTGFSIGIIAEKDLVVIQYTIDMKQALSSALSDVAPLFIQTVQEWRKICSDMSIWHQSQVASGSSQRGHQPHHRV